MTKLYYLLVLSFIFSCKSQPNTANKNKEKIDEVCNQIMQDFKKQNIADAMNLLKANSRLIGDSNINNLGKQIQQQITDGVFRQYGECLSYEFVMEKRINNFAAKRYYVLRYKLFFLKFAFSLYDTDPKWTITGFKYDQDGSDLF
ncbi:MAG: hypothetical protein ABIN01_21700 [Ferruginibacter sp.]